MTHDYKRNGTTTLFAALNILDGTVVGRCMPSHTHKEFIKFLNAVEHAVPAGKLVHAIADNYATHRQSQSAAVARPPPALGIPFHAHLRILAQRRRRLLLDHHPPAHPSRGLQIRRRPAGRYSPLYPRAQPILKTFPLDQTGRNHPRQTHPPACTFRMSQCTSYHYLPPAEFSEADAGLVADALEALRGTALPVHQ